MASHDTYDVVVIGSGLGGLLSAVILAKEGMKVCVLERDKQIGGCLQTFSLQKKVFDSCVHYIGGLGEGGTLHQIFSYAGIIDQLALKAFDPGGFDRIAFADEALMYPQAIGKENFVAQLSSYFPGEENALKQYVDYMSYVGDRFPLYRLRNGHADEKAPVSALRLPETIAQFTSNPVLQGVLTGNNLLYAGLHDKTPFHVHALVLESYIHSTHKVVPGSSQISKMLWKVLQEHGGEVHREHDVTLLKEENGAITYADTATGQRFYGKQFISNIHPKRLLQILDSSVLRPAYRNRINGLDETISTFMLNLVLKPGTVPMRHHNIYWHRTHDVWAATNYIPAHWPANYAAFFTEDAANPGFAESASILSYMHYNEVAEWALTENLTANRGDRGETYAVFKEERSQKLLSILQQRIPELKGNIQAYSAATPLTYRDYTATPEGGMYGLQKDLNKPAETAIATRTRIPNLLQTGQNVNLHGVLGVSITAIATCAELLGMDYLLNKINGKDTY